MKAGLLKEQIQIFKPVVVKTEYGSSKIQYEAYKTTRCHVINNSGNKQDSNNEIFYSNSKTFIIRHYIDIKENMRIKYEGVMYAIESITPNKYYNNKEIFANKVNE